LLALLPTRADLAGLPSRGAKECELDAEATKNLQALSLSAATLRRRQSRANKLDIAALATSFDTSEWRTEKAVSALEQVLQTEEFAVRLVLVRQLNRIPGATAGAALARRAVFDVSVEVRGAAIEALQHRAAEDFRATLLQSFRYPWAPAADHAAEAIAAIGDYQMVKELEKMVDLPDPTAPAYDADKKKWLKPELVRINHFSNCALCHAASHDKKDSVRGPVPERGKPLPTAYYRDNLGPAIRVDITYLRQDFSVMQRVDNAEPWPEYQRFDYLVRQFVVPEAEAAKLAAATRGRDYPQRQAVLSAIRELNRRFRHLGSTHRPDSRKCLERPWLAAT
jgi:hypothetical protein